jgi:hypothetical protein
MALALLIATPAQAEPSCEIRVRPDARAWRAAVKDVDEVVRRAQGADCQEILVEPDEHGATVRLTTHDQRTAIRRVARPTELFALVEALLVRVDEAPVREAAVVPARAEPPAIEEPGLAPAPQVAPAERDVAAPKTNEPTGELIALTAGAATGEGGVGTIGMAQVGFLRENWELALAASIAPEHDTDRSHVRASAYGGGALVARRFAVGPAVFFVGGDIGLYSASLEEGRRAVAGSAPVEDTILEPRTGLTLGCIAPMTARFRFRGQIDGQVGIFEHTRSAPELPSFSHVTLALTVGAETTFLP